MNRREGYNWDTKNNYLKREPEITLKYLNYMEHFSVGINTEVYNITIFDRLIGTREIAISTALSAFIDYRRINIGNPRLYSDYENMIIDLKKSVKLATIHKQTEIL